MSENFGKSIQSSIVCLRATINELKATIRNIETQTNKLLQSSDRYSDNIRRQLLSKYLENLNMLQQDLSHVHVKHTQCNDIKF